MAIKKNSANGRIQFAKTNKILAATSRNNEGFKHKQNELKTKNKKGISVKAGAATIKWNIAYTKK